MQIFCKHFDEFPSTFEDCMVKIASFPEIVFNKVKNIEEIRVWLKESFLDSRQEIFD